MKSRMAAHPFDLASARCFPQQRQDNTFGESGFTILFYLCREARCGVRPSVRQRQSDRYDALTHLMLGAEPASARSKVVLTVS
jgi:hypothetical protein